MIRLMGCNKIRGVENENLLEIKTMK